MADDIPDWALIKACDMSFPTEKNLSDMTKLNEARDDSALQAFARYIAQNEEPPVDPLLIEAREICASEVGGGIRKDSAYLKGDLDDWFVVQATLRALKRGMELEREASQ